MLYGRTRFSPAVTHWPHPGRPTIAREIACLAGVVVGAIAGATLLVAVTGSPRAPETSLVIGVGLLGLLLALIPAAYVVVQRRAIDPGVLGLLVLAVGGVGLVAAYLAAVWPYVRFPADVLIWSESDFVNDIIKLRTGYPLYTSPVNNE